MISCPYSAISVTGGAANVINKSKISGYSETKRKDVRDGRREGRSNSGGHEDEHGEVGREHCCPIRFVDVCERKLMDLARS